MIVSETFNKNGVELIERYSDEGKMLIRNDGVEFESAVDRVESSYTYMEADVSTEDGGDSM